MPLYALPPTPDDPGQPRAERRPEVHAGAFVAPDADVIGSVRVLDGASVWFHAVLRGDAEAVVVGRGVNVQDGAVLHADPGFPCVLEENVTVGHRAIVHGATCAAGSLVGMGAIMLNGSRLGRGAVLGAGALLPEGKEVPDGLLAVGVPARVVGPATVGGGAATYQTRAAMYRQGLREVTPQECQAAAGEPA